MNFLLEKINNLYGLHINSFEKVTKGCLSENNIIISADKKFFLKKYRFDNKEKIEEIHSAKKYFADGGIPVILPIKNKEEKTYFSFENEYYSIFPFVQDKQLDRSVLTDDAIVSLGEMLGRIHLLGSHAKLTIKESFKFWDKKKTLEKIEDIEVEIMRKVILTDFDKLALKNLEFKKGLIINNSLISKDFELPCDHLIHGDYLDHNVFFSETDQVSYVFDFEKANYSPRVYELFRSLVYIFPVDDKDGNGLRKTKLYLDSYLKIYPMSKNELSKGLKLFYLKNIHDTWIEREHYLKNNTRADEFLESSVKRTKYLTNFYDDFESKLLEGLM